jgi:hypothetical protein
MAFMDDKRHIMDDNCYMQMRIALMDEKHIFNGKT